MVQLRLWGLWLLLAGSAAAIAGCGSSSSNKNPAAPSIASVSACLQSAGYGVTQVPASSVGPGGSENRGPGQTGELLVGRQGARPRAGADDADAVIAFWSSSAKAKSSPNARDKSIGSHADVIGKVTVQPALHLVLYAIKAGSSPTERRAVFEAEVKKVEGCV